MEDKNHSKNPWVEGIKEMTIAAMQGMIDEIKNERFCTNEWNLYRQLIGNGISYFENKVLHGELKQPKQQD